MKQALFEQMNQPFWQEYAELVGLLEKKQTCDFRQFVPAYRRLCQHIAIARHRGYSPHLVEYLNQLNWRGHQLLYKRPSMTWIGLMGFLRFGFPQAVRAHAKVISIASLLMYGPSLVLIALILWQPDWVYSLLDSHEVARFEAMYDPDAERLGEARDAESNVHMFGFYIQNNISVAFRTFATGIAFTLGSLFFLVFNGVYFGAVAGHLSHIGYTEPFWTFVVAHSAFEVTAITFAGAAGIKMGFALLAPGLQTRAQALQRAARDVVPILYGTILMLVIAAFIEAFWSSNHSISAAIKYSVGGGMWLLVLLYFLRVGRWRESI
ncbi:stage II sporulation protein M [Hahella ganghwensis]|uniref:stage II sporulation protein M n=1 Tax=Hahella ganghwensis TaxID=286420 RepID=UPI000378AA8C|nr:stage II sporulation protein M [Hahella ganghwensis]